MNSATDPRWAKILSRDPAADGLFVYSVRTTGIYCRPTCAARRPNPQNVRFHDTAADAEAAGFRPCRRCAPARPSRARQQADLIADACRAIENAETPPALAVLAKGAGLSPHHFHRVFKAITGLTPRDYAASHRAVRIRRDLIAAARVTDAIYDAGFGAPSRFYDRADAILGMTPTQYRHGGKSAAIRFAIGACSLGSILVAASDIGICAISFGDDPDALLHDLQDRFPKAVLIGADPGFEATIATVVGFVEAPRLGLDLPLDIRGTAFQQRVWRALAALPPGATARYADIARAIGAPAAVRAVANACGANALAVAIPCHRVVRTDGALSGYRWGIDRKRALLRREAAQALSDNE